MKFLTLSVIDADGQSSGYNFETESGTLNPEETISALENVLFGNDALFGGENELTVLLNGEKYVVRRDFARGAEVRKNGLPLPDDDAVTIINEIAALGNKQWRANSAPCDTEAFVSDTASYVEKYLSSLGFDSEELERQTEVFEERKNTVAIQSAALNEFVSTLSPEADMTAAEEELRAAEEHLEKTVVLCAEHFENAVRIKQKEELSAELAALQEKTPEMEKAAEALAADDKLKENLTVYNKVNELKAESAAMQADAEALASEIENDEKETESLVSLLEEKEAAYKETEEKASALREELERILFENEEKGELTAAVNERAAASDGEIAGLEKAAADYAEQNRKFAELSDKLASERLSYKKRQSIREGVAFETTLDDKRDRLNMLTNVIAAQKEIIETIETEIKDSEALYSMEGRARLSDSDKQRMKLFRSKILCQSLQVDISAAEQKIRANEEARRSYAEDIEALTKAKVAINEYVAKREARKGKLGDKLISLKARLSFCKDVDEMEYGSLCPICHGRITDKIELSKENSRLSSSYEKYSDELAESREILQEYYAKLEKVDTRLGQLNERDKLCSSYLDSLNVTVSAKQTALTAILKEVGANSVPTLEKMYDAATDDFSRLSEAGADGAFLHEHIKYLTNQVEVLNEKLEKLYAEAEDLQSQIDDMSNAYEESLAPELDGRTAYDMLEEIIAVEKEEDELFEELLETDKRRNECAEILFNSSRASGSEYVNAAADIIYDTVVDIRHLDEKKQQLLAEKTELEQRLQETKAVIEQKVDLLRNLTEKTEENYKAASETLEKSELPEIDADALSEMEQNALSEEEREHLLAEIKDFDEKSTELSTEIAKLENKITDSEFDEEALSAAKEKFKTASENLVKIKERNLASAAAFEFARKRNAECDAISERIAALKKLADGEITEVILPAFDDALKLAGSDATASADGNGISFTLNDRKGTRLLDANSIDREILDSAVNCTLNYVLRLASGQETIRFLHAEKREEMRAAAEKYGVILL